MNVLKPSKYLSGSSKTLCSKSPDGFAVDNIEILVVNQRLSASGLC